MVKKILILCVFLITFQQTLNAQQPSTCNTEEHHILDFWIGTWEVTWDGGEGTNTISKKVGECAIQESFISESLKGMSISSYEKSSGKWRQIWVDNQNSFIDFVGNKDGENYIFQTTPNIEKPSTQFRMVFSDIKENSLIWTWQKTDNNGEKWHDLWKINYKRMK